MGQHPCTVVILVEQTDDEDLTTSNLVQTSSLKKKDPRSNSELPVVTMFSMTFYE